jgi:hypothetical protein
MLYKALPLRARRRCLGAALLPKNKNCFPVCKRRRSAVPSGADALRVPSRLDVRRVRAHRHEEDMPL